MKKLIYLLVLTFVIISCSSDDNDIKGNFEFVAQYSATVTVGGVVGTRVRVFEPGETYKGTDKGKEIIKIRIAGHSKLNEDCPNSWCYQEFLEVPRSYLKLVE